MHSIKESKELLLFIAKLANAVDKALANGSIDVADVTLVFDPLFAAKSAFDDVTLVPQELFDVDEDEATELVEAVKQELSLRNDVAEELTEEGLAIAIRLVLFINKIRSSKSEV